MSHPNLNDAKLYALRAVLGVADGQTTQLERDALILKGAIGEQVNDLWMDYLINVAAMSQEAGQLNDMQYNWLGELGFYGNLNERWLQFWNNDWVEAGVTEDFRSQSAHGWNCVRASTALNTSVDRKLSIYSDNQVRFLADLGVWIEAGRTNHVPKTVSYTAWSPTGGAILSQAVSICNNENGGVFTCDIGGAASYHRITCTVPVGASQYLGFYFKPDPAKSKYRVDYRGVVFNIDSSGNSDQPTLVRSAPLFDGWFWFEIDVTTGTSSNILSIAMLDNNGDTLWVADAAYSMSLYGCHSYYNPFALSYFTNDSVGNTTAEKDVIHKAPWAGFDGNDFELVMGFVPNFSSDQGVTAGGTIVLFEFGQASLDQIKVYYNMANRQMIFDRYAVGVSSYVIANPQLEFSAYEQLIVTIRQTALDGISIEVKNSSAFSDTAGAKTVSNLPVGDMYLGSDIFGDGQINGSIPFIEFYNPAPVTMRQIR